MEAKFAYIVSMNDGAVFSGEKAAEAIQAALALILGPGPSYESLGKIAIYSVKSNGTDPQTMLPKYERCDMGELHMSYDAAELEEVATKVAFFCGALGTTDNAIVSVAGYGQAHIRCVPASLPHIADMAEVRAKALARRTEDNAHAYAALKPEIERGASRSEIDAMIPRLVEEGKSAARDFAAARHAVFMKACKLGVPHPPRNYELSWTKTFKARHGEMTDKYYADLQAKYGDVAGAKDAAEQAKLDASAKKRAPRG